MRRAGIRCPAVVKLKKNVLVMSFIGIDGEAAPKLKDVGLDQQQLQSAYNECVEVSSGRVRLAENGSLRITSLRFYTIPKLLC